MKVDGGQNTVLSNESCYHSNQKVSHLDADNQKLSGQLKEASLQVETLSNAADTPQSSPQDVALLKEEIESLKSKLSQQVCMYVAGCIHIW